MLKVQVAAHDGTINGRRAVAITFEPEVELPFVWAGSARTIRPQGIVDDPGFPPQLAALAPGFEAAGAWQIMALPSVHQVFVIFDPRLGMNAATMDHLNVVATRNLLAASGHFLIES